ncbi:helix-turn-helix domain-containing protein [Halalkalibacter alkaliphilus]|uniref:Helix-turn-helix domain-containing protein n=1 Tax=Halalkalibacter alkaliphilus TaxID=2917993 RepID=A0A9X2CWS1_9BACI|nr:helix-turn-helix domain-containing protein [Halalkalibacter alkaliphilus]
MEEIDKQKANDLEELANKTIGKNISGIRNMQGMSRLTLAAKANLDYSYLGQIERGEVTMSHFILLKLCCALDIRMSNSLYEDVPDAVTHFLKEINPID